jgi:hypothetical protein
MCTSRRSYTRYIVSWSEWNTERYSAQKYFKITTPNPGTTGSITDIGSGYHNATDANAKLSRATKIFKMWIPGAKFAKSRVIKYENTDSRTKFFDYHALLYAYSNYSTNQDVYYVARVNDFVLQFKCKDA